MIAIKLSKKILIKKFVGTPLSANFQFRKRVESPKTKDGPGTEVGPTGERCLNVANILEI